MKRVLNNFAGRVSAIFSILMIVFGISTLFVSHPAVAQSRLSWEVRSGIAFATQDLGDADLGTGFGFEGTLAYRFMPHLAGYAGWGWHRFSADQSFAGTNADFEETGYTFGLQFVHPLGKLPLDYFVRGGGIFNHIETENGEGNITADSGHGLGWQVETGLAIPLGNHWQLMPGVRYRSLSRDIEIGTVSTAVDLTYLTVGVGISRSF